MMDIVCFSQNNWEKRWARKQHLMHKFSLHEKAGKVLYIEPAVTLLRLLVNPFKELSNKENRSRWMRALFSRTTKYNDSLYIYTPIALFVFEWRVYGFYKLNRFLSIIFIRLKMFGLGIKKPVLWLYNPHDHCLLKWFKPRIRSCFDWAEVWTEYFKTVAKIDVPNIENMENKMLQDVDIVFTCTEYMYDKAKTINNNTYLLRSGADIDFFKGKHDLPNDMKKLPKPIVGYTGTLSARVNVKWVEFLSKQLPNISIVFVGGIHSQDRVDSLSLKKCSNVYLLGLKSYWDIAPYYANIDVFILPYIPEKVQSEVTKIYECFVTGKPIVVSNLRQFERLKDIVSLADNKENFVECVKTALKENGGHKVKLRQELANSASWIKRVQEIINVLDLAQ